MLYIGICDDDAFQIRYIQKEIHEYLKSIKCEYEIRSWTSVSQLLDYLNQEQNLLDFILMDIELQEITGIEAAKKVKLKRPECQIAYCSNYLHYATEVYETEHCYYILKNQFHEKLPFLIHKVCDEKFKEEEKVVISFDGMSQIVQQSDILYLERDRKITFVVCEKDIYKTTLPLNVLQEGLNPQRFVRCHNSFVVNFMQVSEYKRQSFKLKNGEIISISRNYIESVKIAFKDWVRTQI